MNYEDQPTSTEFQVVTSRWNCHRCNKPSSMYGHFTSIHWAGTDRVSVEGHFHCPGDCELEKREDGTG